MSLINDALRDLDQREQNACTAAKDSLAAETPLSKNNSETILDQSNKTVGGIVCSARKEGYFFYGIIAMLILLCGGYVLFYQKVLSSSQNDRGSVDLVGALPNRGGSTAGTGGGKTKVNSVVKEKTIQNRSVVPLLLTEQELVVKLPSSNQSNLGELVSLYLAKASRSIKQNRLSVPVRNNAIYFLNEALKLDPKNKQALGEIKNITGLYVQQVDYALAQKNISRAKILISRYEKFGLEISAREGYLTEIENAEREENTAFKVAVSDGNSTFHIKQNQSNDSAWVEVTSESEDLQNVAIAKELFSRGDSYSAIRLLEEYIARQPQALNSLICLFDFHAGDADYSKAQVVLSDLPETHIARAYFEAKIASHSIGENSAIVILESSPPNEKMKEKQGAYLAALYQKEKRYQEAQSAYAKLLRIDESNPRYLLGFAVAADARGESFSSLRAYKKLLFVGHSSDKVANFVKKRVKTLSASSQKEVSAW